MARDRGDAADVRGSYGSPGGAGGLLSGARPAVALTTTAEPDSGRYDRPQITLYTAYIEAVDRCGLTPLLATPAHSERSLDALLDHCRGLVLSGGVDIDPASYGEEPIEGLGTVLPERDAMEMRCLERALERRMPVLALCRGLQLLNVYLGGTLYQDLAEQRPEATSHRQARWSGRTQRIRIAPDSRFASILGSDDVRINSFHHQAIKDVADELEVAATAEDGLIEAAEAPAWPWVVGVQWHPERYEATAPETDPDRRLFAAFADAVAEYEAEGAR